MFQHLVFQFVLKCFSFLSFTFYFILQHCKLFYFKVSVFILKCFRFLSYILYIVKHFSLLCFSLFYFEVFQLLSGRFENRRQPEAIYWETRLWPVWCKTALLKPFAFVPARWADRWAGRHVLCSVFRSNRIRMRRRSSWQLSEISSKALYSWTRGRYWEEGVESKTVEAWSNRKWTVVLNKTGI